MLMAIMIPQTPMDEDFNHSAGEKRLFETLKKLPNDFVIFYSVAWNRRDERGNIRWGKSDYTVFHKRRGILTIEVKEGAISCESNGIIIQTNRRTGEQKRIQPMEQACRSKYTFADLLSDMDERFWIESVVWFTSIRRGSIQGRLPISYQEENVLYEDDLNSPFKALMRAYDFYQMEERRHSEDAVNEVIDRLAPCFQAFPSLSSIYQDQEYIFNRMTREQSFLLDYLEEQKTAAIQGAAGTGKTVLAVEKAYRLSKQEKVLFLCYNRNLYQDLRRKWHDRMPNVDFYNLQALATRATKKKASMEDVTYFLLDYQNYLGGWKYKSIIVDEGQDFLKDHLAYLQEIARETDGSFYIFYDQHQLTQQPLWEAKNKDEKTAEKDLLAWVKDFECRLVLNMNCRNTRSIAETAGIPVNVTNIRMRQEIIGEKPKFHILRTKEEAISSIGSIIRSYTDEGIKKEQIVILTVRNTTTSILNGLSSVAGYRLCSDKEETRSGILFTTTKRFKGLEADVVILVDLDEDSFDSFESRNLYYVGASRAKHFLEMVAILNAEQEQVLATTLVDEGKNARMMLMKGLKVKVQSH